MPRDWTHHLNLPDGTRVGYALVGRGDVFRVKFVGPAGRVERTTGCRTEADAHLAAYRVILAELRPAGTVAAGGPAWDEVAADIAAFPGLRDATRKDYLDTVRAFRATVPGSAGPADVTPDVAKQFRRLYLTGTFRRGAGPDAAAYPRSARTVASRLNKLSSLWQKHFIEDLDIVPSNPWAGVRPPPQETKAVAAPTAADVAELLAYLEGRYPGWPHPALFVRTKEWVGCRLFDLCQVRSDQLRDGRLHFDAAQTKTRAGRSVALPADLAAGLDRAKGAAWLWEGVADGAARFRRSRNRRPPAAFSPRFVYHVISNIFREFNESRPGRPRVRTHGLRRRAVTETVEAAGGSVDAAANAIGMTRQTAAKHYLDAKQAFDADATFRSREELRAKRGGREAVEEQPPDRTGEKP